MSMTEGFYSRYYTELGTVKSRPFAVWSLGYNRCVARSDYFRLPTAVFDRPTVFGPGRENARVSVRTKALLAGGIVILAIGFTVMALGGR